MEPPGSRQGTTMHSDRPSTIQRQSTATPSAENDSDKLPPDGDLPQRPRTTSPPGVRIEGVRVQIPSAPLQEPISNTEPVLYGLHTATLAIELPAQLLESTSGLRCRHLTVDLHRQVI